MSQLLISLLFGKLVKFPSWGHLTKQRRTGDKYSYFELRSCCTDPSYFIEESAENDDHKLKTMEKDIFMVMVVGLPIGP